MFKRGFTLIELLAVIIILVVIALIATPVILGVVGKAKISALKDTAYGIIDAGKYDYDENILKGSYDGTYVQFSNGKILSGKQINISGKLPDSGDMRVNEKDR